MGWKRGRVVRKIKGQKKICQEKHRGRKKRTKKKRGGGGHQIAKERNFKDETK